MGDTAATLKRGRCPYCGYYGYAFWPRCPYARCASTLDLRMVFMAGGTARMETV